MTRRHTRRTFLTAAAGAGALAMAGDPLAALRKSAARPLPPLARDARFRQGIASGEPATDGITLWTRLEGLERRARLQVEISPDADFRRVVYRKTVVAEPDADFTVHHRATPKALRPGEEFHYRFFTCDQDSPAGRFRTLVPPDSGEPVRIGFYSCQNYAAGYYTAHAGLLDEPDLDLVVCLGDYIYERTGETGIPARRDRTGANQDSLVETLPEYREKYRLYHQDSDLLAVRARFPMLATWDDHETENNNAGAQPSPNPGQQNVGVRRVPYGERRLNGWRAFFEHLPLTRAPGDPSRIYGSHRLGANAELFMLDERQYRDPQACGDRSIEPCGEQRNPRTLLGAGQKSWFKNGLAGSGAAWKLVGNPVMIMSIDVPAGNAVNNDQWDGYALEREEIIRHIQQQGIRDVSFITGDIHSFFAGGVSPSGRSDPSGFGATEFACGSVTSKGVAEDFEESDSPIPGLTGEGALLGNNPHMSYANLVRHGYGVVEARPSELLVTFRGPRSTQQPKSVVETLARFRVARGSTAVEVLERAA